MSAFDPMRTSPSRLRPPLGSTPTRKTFDVGVDTRTGVEDEDYQVPFRFTGKLDKLTVKLGPVQLTSEDHRVIQHARAGANN